MKCVCAHYFRNRSIAFHFAFISVWLIGLTIGVLLSVYTPTDIRDVVYSLPEGNVSAFALFAANTIPLLFCVVLFQFARPTCAMPVLFLKSLVFAYSSQSIVLAYGNAGWLARWILTMSSSCSAVLLLLFCCINFDKQGSRLFSSAILTIVIIAILVYIDFYAVQPLCVALLKLS